jgi:phosphoribosylaminoimidazolecarboxamide formyltransferase/IMP cyclohydrolase
MDLCHIFEEPCCVAVKHNNPCGVSLGITTLEATEKALKSDPVSVFGGVVAINREVTRDVAEELSKIFLECIIAPSFDGDAQEVLRNKKNLRLLEYDFSNHKKESQLRSIAGGYLLQSCDVVETTWNPEWKIYGEKPSQQIKKDLLFAWRVCSALKSNAIAIAENELSLGLGMGQVSRIDSVMQALERLTKFHKDYKNPVMASDAFFPFADSIEIAAKMGVHWVIQPGGSVKDEEVIKMAEKMKVNMIMTGTRHFRH